MTFRAAEQQQEKKNASLSAGGVSPMRGGVEVCVVFFGGGGGGVCFDSSTMGRMTLVYTVSSKLLGLHLAIPADLNGK